MGQRGLRIVDELLLDILPTGFKLALILRGQGPDIELCGPFLPLCKFPFRGSFAPFLEKSIAMAYVGPEYTAPGTRLFVDIRGSLTPAGVVPLPRIIVSTTNFFALSGTSVTMS